MTIIAGWALQNSTVQTFLTRQVTAHLSDQLDAHVSVGRVHISFFNKMILEDVLVEDQQGDTLIFTKFLSAYIDELNFGRQRLSMDKLTFENSLIRIKRDSVNRFN